MSRRTVPLIGSLVLVLAACTSGGATPSATPGASSPPASSPSASPSDSVPPDTGIGGGGGGNPGDPGGPGDGQPQLVAVVPNALDPHPVVVTKITPALAGNRVAVQLEWMSGVEPCNVLTAIDESREGNTIHLTVLEGTGDPNAFCIEIAVLKAHIWDLGELASGDWTISAEGEAAPVTITVP